MGILINHGGSSAITLGQLSLALPLVALGLGLGYCVWLCIYNVFFHPLRNFPGPKLAALSRVPYSRILVGGTGHHRILELHLKYGPVVRVAPNTLSFSHPDATNDIRGHRKPGQPEHRKDPIRQEVNLHNIIGANRMDHTRFRRSLANGFSHQAMLDQEPIIRGYVDQLMEGLKKQSSNGTQPVDMVRWFNYATFDIIGDLSFGEPFGCLQSSHYDPWIQLIFTSIKNLVFLGTIKHFRILPKLMAKIFMPRDLANKYAENQQLSAMKVRKRLDTGSNRPDFITSMTAKRNGTSLTFEELTSNATILIVAGSETTATALSAAAYFLGLNPEAQAKLAHEVRSTFKHADDITITSVQHLTYMLAVLDEVMRLYPPVVAGLPRLTAEGGAVIAGQYVPENTFVEVWQWPLFHNPNYWEQPEDFIPERWLGDPKFANDRRDAFQPFSTGPRNCVGKNLAYSEMRMILARVILEYDIKLADGTEGWDKRSKAFTLWEKGPVNVYMTPRKME
uniref:Tri11 protein n=1 Tax=Trichoderma brevicompactum TaxID=247546 RepID=A0A141AU33_9HYPO|nr:tri11 protein [Trichoderma brevicompactum]